MKKDQKTPIQTLVCVSFFVVTAGLISSAASYNPREPILLNCGASGQANDSDNRPWTGDAGSKYALSSNGISATAPPVDPSVPTVPYMTARLFTSPFTYFFPLGPGRVFVRLHLYPSNYSNAFTASNALFAVTSGAYTLLNNFSAYQTAEAISDSYFFREYSINVSAAGGLNLTFAPSSRPGSYAFVNGIEIVSIPDIFSSPTDGPSMVGGGTYPVDPNSALQTMYRLNVGGQSVSPVQDSGLFRTWVDDTPYILGAATGVTFGIGPNVSITYTDSVPSYIAPVPVYSTARQMSGDSPQINMNYNITWTLTVDAGFYYLVRMHFCEIQYPMTSVNQRVFDIYLNNQTAQEEADVIAWSGGIGRPTYKDYVLVTPGTGLLDLWVALHPDMRSSPAFADVLLNGLEIFKLQDTDGNLAGPNPEPPSNSTGGSNGAASNRQPPKPKRSKAPGIAGGVIAGAVVVLLLGFFCLYCRFRRQKKRARDVGTGDGPSGWPPLSLFRNSHSTASVKTKATCRSNASSLPSNLCRRFSFAEIEAATNGFDEARLLGVGGFGKVYRGEADGGTAEVAIKRGSPLSSQGAREFQTEIEMLSKLRHRHLVSLIGYCEENCEMILVYDYMARGTLRDHLYGAQKPPLPWKQRLEICIGAARGLHYLHGGTNHPIIHRDVKSSNILLDDNWVAKVSDFGLSRTGPGLDHTHVSTVVKGSPGYLDPEYVRRRQMNVKSDVYSFGVVLFEILCARPALDPALPRERSSLVEWALRCLRTGTLDQIIDPFLKGDIAPPCFKVFAETAAKCTADVGIERPSMGDVLWKLEFALQLQESADGGGPRKSCATSDDEMPLQGNNATDSLAEVRSMSLTTTSTMSFGGRSLASELTVGAVFSQIRDPEGR